MSPTLASLASVIAVSLLALAGLATISVSGDRLRALARLFVSFAVGALLGDAFIHLLPEIFKESGGPGSPLLRSLLVLCGMLLFFIVEKLLKHRHGLLHQHLHDGQAVGQPALAAINLLGDAIHNFIDGVLIGASYLAGPELGISTTVAVLLHELPQELADFGILIHSGLTVKRAVLLNLASASVAILGTVAALVLGAHAQIAVQALLPLTAGGFVYLASADLIPELQHDRSLKGLLVQTSLICLGISVMGLLTLVE